MIGRVWLQRTPGVQREHTGLLQAAHGLRSQQPHELVSYVYCIRLFYNDRMIAILLICICHNNRTIIILLVRMYTLHSMHIHSYLYIHLSYAHTQCRNGPGFIDPYFEPFNIIPDPYYGLLATDILGSIYNFTYLVLVNLVLQAIISGPCIYVCVLYVCIYIYSCVYALMCEYVHAYVCYAKHF